MAVYVIADLHLSTNAKTDKSMEVFGARWQGYTEKLKRAWCSLVAEGDTVIVPGDISWALTLPEAHSDLAFLNALPGKKILMKGNHDFWWTSISKMEKYCSENGFDTLSFLHHSATVVERFIVCGTRGWFYEEGADKTTPGEAARLTARESLRLKISLDAARALAAAHPTLETVAFFHFPPVWGGVEGRSFTEQLREAGIRRCYFGHIHGAYAAPHVTELDGIRYYLAAADYLSFTPLHIPPCENGK